MPSSFYPTLTEFRKRVSWSFDDYIA